MSAPDGGPAFPIPGLHDDADFNGMTLRDYFAAKAMQAALQAMIASGSATEKEHAAQLAKVVYFMADAMLKERAK